MPKRTRALVVGSRWRPSEQAAALGLACGLTTVKRSMGLPRPPGSPITLQATGCSPSLPAAPAARPSAGPGGAVRTHYFAPDGHQRPAETPVRTAFSPRLLMRPEVKSSQAHHSGSDLLKRSS